MYKGTPNCLMYCSGAKSPTVASSLLPVASLVPVKQKTARRRFNVQSLRGVMDQTVYDGWHVNTTKFTTPSMCVCKNYKNPTYREVNSLIYKDHDLLQCQGQSSKYNDLTFQL